MGMHKDGGLVSRTVREALGTLVSPQVCTQLIARALQAAGLTEVPETGRPVADWIEGALRREVELAVGMDAADLVAAQLAPIVAHAAAAVVRPAVARDPFGSDKPTGLAPAPKLSREQLARTARMRVTPEQLKLLRPDAADDRHTSRPEPGEAEQGQPLPRVLAASAQREAVQTIARQLQGTAEVVQVADLVGLLDALDEATSLKPIVLVDCQRPTVHVTSIAAIGEDLPRGTTIVLWGASDHAWRELDRDRVPSCRWVRCSLEATTDDVGSLCSMLIRGT